MRPKKHSFVWTDRDTVARQLLQLVMIAPHFVKIRAMQLLQAIRSPAIIPDLIDIYLSPREDYDTFIGYYALKALQTTPTWYEESKYPEIDKRLQGEGNYWNGFRLASAGGADFYMPHLAEGVDKFFAGMPYNGLMDGPVYNSTLSRQIILCPSNWDWFYERISQIKSMKVVYLLIEMYDEANGHLLKAIASGLSAYLDKHPELMLPESLDILADYLTEDEKQQWLDKHRDRLIYVCLAYPIEKIYKFLCKWDVLKQAVIENCPAILPELQALDTQDPPPFKDYATSPIYQYIYKLYTYTNRDGRARSENRKAQFKLIRFGRNTHNIPLEACGMHIVRKRGRRTIYGRDSRIIELSRAYEYYEIPPPPHDDYLPSWETKPPNIENVYSPLRFEAGEGLRDRPTPESWGALVNGFFIEPRAKLDPFLLDWIAHVTDQLDGVHTAYAGKLFPVEERPWFIELSRMPEDILESLV